MLYSTWAKVESSAVCFCVFMAVWAWLSSNISRVSFASCGISCFLSRDSPVVGIPPLSLCLQVRKGKSDSMPEGVPQPSRSSRLPHARPFSIPIVLPLTSEMRSPSPEAMETTPIPQTRQDTPDVASHHSHLSVSPSGSTEALSRSVCDEAHVLEKIWNIILCEF